MFLYRNKALFSSLLLIIFLSVLFSACSPDNSPGPDVKNFRDQMLKDVHALESRIIPAFKSDEPVPAAGETIGAFLLELKNADHRLYGIGLLDNTGEYLTGYVLEDKKSGKLIKDTYKNMNFRSFKVVEKIIKSRKILQETLYFQEAKILAVGFPLISDGNLLGILCFSFKSHEFEKKWGISEKEFLSIKFSDN